MHQVKIAVLPVAGLGTRVLPATKAIPSDIQLTDGMQRLFDTQKFLAVEFEGQPHDCGFVEGYFKTITSFGEDHPETCAAYEELLQSRKMQK